MIHLKTEEQINGIRKACHLTADMFNELTPKIHAGMSTWEIDQLFKNYIEGHGGTPAWYQEDFPGAVCISINEQVIHGLPSKKRIVKDGDLVSLDVGINLNGYISDTTHSLLIGNVPPKVRELQKVTEECLQAGIAACVAGNRIKDVADAVYNVMTPVLTSLVVAINKMNSGKGQALYVEGVSDGDIVRITTDANEKFKKTNGRPLYA